MKLHSILLLLLPSLLSLSHNAKASFISTFQTPTIIRNLPHTHHHPPTTPTTTTTHKRILTTLSAKTKKSKKSNKQRKSSSSSSSVGIKGFGSTSSSTGGGGGIDGNTSSKSNIDRSKPTLEFYSFIETQVGGSPNLKRAALGYFPLHQNNDVTIRGVVALKPISKGDIILSIPYEMALNLGQEGIDPTLPAVELLKRLCEDDDDDDETTTPTNQMAYFKMLPEFGGRDPMGSTDFFSHEALGELQFPIVQDETRMRQQNVKERFESDVSSRNWKWDGEDVTLDHMRWAVWLITSRVLTVQGRSSSYRLMIPFIDMCNHDRTSPHVLTGRAETGGLLKVVAGEDIEVGEQVNICYGGGVAGNDRFIQDYGFLDGDEKAYDIVARQVMGKERNEMGNRIGEKERERVLESLNRTSLEEDEEMVRKEGLKEDVRLAIEFRIGVKKALKRVGM